MIINGFAGTPLNTGMFSIHVRPLLIHPFGGSYINVIECEERRKVKMKCLFSVLQLLEQLVSNQAGHISQTGHIYYLYQGPFPTPCFTSYDGERTHTLHSECIEDHQ